MVECDYCRARPMGSPLCETLYCRVRGSHREAYREIKADPWKHRSEGMKCSTCMWYVPKVKAGQEVPLFYHRLGRCRRHAPTMNGYPVVFTDDWCGDHKLDETKV